MALAAAAVQFWQSTPASYAAAHSLLDVNQQARSLQERMEILAQRVGDMQLLVLVLLATSGLYAIVFVASSYISARSFGRQADRTINFIRDEIGVARADLQELQEQTQRELSGPAQGSGDEDRANAEEVEGARVSVPGVWEAPDCQHVAAHRPLERQEPYRSREAGASAIRE